VLRARDKLAIVTGGARGIGYAIANLLAQEGARVVIADIDAPHGEAAARRIGTRARFERHDVGREADWQALVEGVQRRHLRIDVLVNNAGLYLIKPMAQLGKEFPIGRIGEPIEVAYAALYLASDESRFVTGSELVIDAARPPNDY
jgi:NAD(P)-dependent dehydrogenase (short-subunit alcohol dehydrogenase family)